MSAHRSSPEPAIVTGTALLDPTEVGNKFATLARLRSSGHRVPAFFCVGASAYRDAERRATAGGGDSGRSPGVGVPRVPAVLRQSIAAGMALLESERVAVRGCFVGGDPGMGEDSRDNPMAGVSETILQVQGTDAVVAAVERCWASLHAAEATAYFAQFGIEADSFAVAVAVQAMVDAEASFVAFSADPLGRPDDVVVAAVHGLGDRLMRERADAHHYVVDPANRVEHRSSAAAEPSAAPLTEPELRAVADLVRGIAKQMGSAQDIEGVVAADRPIWLLQARPLAARADRRRVFTNLNVSESFPGLSTPMTFSVASRFYEAAFGDSYRRFGIRASALARESSTLANMLAYIDGRIYYDITSFYRLHSLSPLFPLVRTGWEQKVGISGTRDRVGDHARKRMRLRTLARMSRSVPDVTLTNHRRMRSFESYWSERLPAAQRELHRLHHPMERIDHYLGLWGEVSARWGVTLVNDTIANSLQAICRVLLRPIARDSADGCLADMLTPPEPTLADGFWRQCRQRASGPDAAARRRQLAELLAREGDRCLTGLKLEEPGLGERIDWLRDYASRQAPDPPVHASNAGIWKPPLRHPWRRLRWQLAALLAARLRRLIAHRENHRHLRSQLFAYCRHFLLRLAPDLCRYGVIDQPSDIWFLTDREAIGALDGHGLDLALTEVVAMRKRAAAGHTALAPPAEFSAIGPVPERRWHRPPHPAGDRSGLRGIGSSGGVVRGRAMIVGSPADARGVDRDTIVIAPSTDPSWIAVMAAAGGLVVERGSMLSHTAITGRLLGLPTVVCARDASRLIPEGALVELDGAAGTVQILNTSPEG